MSISSPPTAYEFDLTGHTEFTGSMQFTPSQVATITAVQQSLEQPIRRCNFDHEPIIAQNYTQAEFRGINLARRNGNRLGQEDYRKMIQRCLCPKDIREASPLCAHASEFYEPDPYKNELKTLMHLQIIHRAQWTHWFTTFMKPMIAHSDGMIANNRYDTTVNTPEWREHLQDRDAKFLEQKRQILVQCTNAALQNT